MVKYLSYMTTSYVSKNKAEKAAIDVVVSMNRRIITNDQIPGFKKEFQQKIDQVNKDNPRCKDLILDNWKSYLASDIYFAVSGVFQLALYQGNE